MLTGCGEDLISTGSVSLGGSGTGVGFPDDPPISTNPPQEAPSVEYYYYTPKLQLQNCNGIERTIELENMQTGEPLLNNERNTLEPLSLLARNNVRVRVTVRNLSADTVYEQTTKCTAKLQELDEYGNVMNQSNVENCELDKINVYKPAECKVYRYQFALAQKEALWVFNYHSVYQTMVNGGMDLNTNQCEPLLMNWDVIVGLKLPGSKKSNSAGNLMTSEDCE